eukprot:TRINITY_DN1268_c1_g2_i1.p2 TRINITY_DN1268_c1_g2~~TRINITY_DN1268_c1_g2_i1.p2  ORF type:complete len:207 (-),score=-21.84 TRINITY_DN1268_c1_g2_i1:56-676(-)
MSNIEYLFIVHYITYQQYNNIIGIKPINFSPLLFKFDWYNKLVLQKLISYFINTQVLVLVKFRQKTVQSSQYYVRLCDYHMFKQLQNPYNKLLQNTLVNSFTKQQTQCYICDYHVFQFKRFNILDYRQQNSIQVIQYVIIMYFNLNVLIYYGMWIVKQYVSDLLGIYFMVHIFTTSILSVCGWVDECIRIKNGVNLGLLMHQMGCQ